MADRKMTIRVEAVDAASGVFGRILQNADGLEKKVKALGKATGFRGLGGLDDVFEGGAKLGMGGLAIGGAFLAADAIGKSARSIEELSIAYRNGTKSGQELASTILSSIPLFGTLYSSAADVTSALHELATGQRAAMAANEATLASYARAAKMIREVRKANMEAGAQGAGFAQNDADEAELLNARPEDRAAILERQRAQAERIRRRDIFDARAKATDDAFRPEITELERARAGKGDGREAQAIRNFNAAGGAHTPEQLEEALAAHQDIDNKIAVLEARREREIKALRDAQARAMESADEAAAQRTAAREKEEAQKRAEERMAIEQDAQSALLELQAAAADRSGAELTATLMRLSGSVDREIQKIDERIKALKAQTPKNADEAAERDRVLGLLEQQRRGTAGGGAAQAGFAFGQALPDLIFGKNRGRARDMGPLSPFMPNGEMDGFRAQAVERANRDRVDPAQKTAKNTEGLVPAINKMAADLGAKLDAFQFSGF